MITDIARAVGYADNQMGIYIQMLPPVSVPGCQNILVLVFSLGLQQGALPAVLYTPAHYGSRRIDAQNVTAQKRLRRRN